MNLFYVATSTPTAPDYVVDSNLSLGVSPILLPPFTDAYSFEGSFIVNSLGSGTVNPLTFSKDLHLKDSYNEVYVMSMQLWADYRRLYKVSKNGVLSTISSGEYKIDIASDKGNNRYCYVYAPTTKRLGVMGYVNDEFATSVQISTIQNVRSPNICFGNNSCIICDSEIYRSEDCITWTRVYSDGLVWNHSSEMEGRSWRRIVHTSFGFLIITDHHLLKSFDGITWNVLSLPFISIHNPYWRSLAVNEDTICLTFRNHYDSSELFFSLDGGSSWSNSLIVNDGDVAVFALSEGSKFWTNFIRTTEYL